MKLGEVLKKERERRRITAEEMARRLDVGLKEYRAIESGDSPIEEYARLLMGFAEAIEQPVFNLFYPDGLPFQELDDYP